MDITVPMTVPGSPASGEGGETIGGTGKNQLEFLHISWVSFLRQKPGDATMVPILLIKRLTIKEVPTK